MRSKIEFESFLAHEIEDYLEYRTKVGFTYKKIRWFFSRFDKYIIEKKAGMEDLNSAFLLSFRDKLDVAPGTINKIFIHLRGFFDYLVRMEVIVENPVKQIPPVAERAYIPFIFSPDQIESMLKAVQQNISKKDKYDFLKNLAVYTAIMLMARCGLRISEPVRLKYRHYRHDERTLYIEKTKFNKDRLIPVPKGAVVELENYMAARNAIIDENANGHLLAVDYGAGISTNHIYPRFHRAVRNTGLSEPSRIVGNTMFGDPRPHCLRHSFAVNTLKAVRQRGGSPQNALAILAAYMGHTDYRYTMKYLKVIDAEHRKALVDFSITRGKKQVL